MLPAELKNFSQVRNMGTEVLGENQNVIHIDKTFLKPKGILRNSNIPKGVMMAVLWMSEADIGTWYYPFCRSNLEKTEEPSKQM